MNFKMKKIFSLTLLALISLLTIHAQNNYIPGYIITNNKDTINGLIECGPDSQNSKSCHFKSAMTDSLQSFLPDQIAGYQFTTKVKNTYVSKSVTINGTYKTSFLESLVQGKISLYCLEDKSDEKTTPLYFFENENGETNYITKDPDQVTLLKNGYTRKQLDNKYKGTLHFIFRDCEMMGEKAHNTEYKKEELIGLTKEYNKKAGTSKDKSIEFKYEHLIKLDYSVYVEKEILAATQQIYGYYGKFKSLTPAIGIQTNLSIPRCVKSLSIQADLSMRKNSSLFGNDSQTFWRPNYYLLSLGLGTKYTYQKGIIRPSIEAGIRNMYPTNPQVWGDYLRFENFLTLGLNPPIGNNHFLLFTIGLKFDDLGYFGIPPQHNTIFDQSWTVKLGYTF